MGHSLHVDILVLTSQPLYHVPFFGFHWKHVEISYSVSIRELSILHQVLRSLTVSLFLQGGHTTIKFTFFICMCIITVPTEDEFASWCEICTNTPHNMNDSLCFFNSYRINICDRTYYIGTGICRIELLELDSDYCWP